MHGLSYFWFFFFAFCSHYDFQNAPVVSKMIYKIMLQLKVLIFLKHQFLLIIFNICVLSIKAHLGSTFVHKSPNYRPKHENLKQVSKSYNCDFPLYQIHTITINLCWTPVSIAVWYTCIVSDILKSYKREVICKLGGVSVVIVYCYVFKWFSSFLLFVC